jgi:hypothetical protein
LRRKDERSKAEMYKKERNKERKRETEKKLGRKKLHKIKKEEKMNGKKDLKGTMKKGKMAMINKINKSPRSQGVQRHLLGSNNFLYQVIIFLT